MIALILLMAALIIPLTATAQAVVGTVASYNSVGVSSSSHTTGNLTISGSDRLLSVCIVSEEDATADETPTSATLDVPGASQSFSLAVASGSSDQPGSPFHASIWVLPNPSLGTYPITYTFANPVQSSAIIVPFTNAKPSQPVLSDSDLVHGATPPGVATGNVTTTVDNTLLLACTHSNQADHTHTPGAGQNEQGSELTVAEGKQWTVSISTKVVSPAGGGSMSTTAENGLFGTDNMRFGMVGIEPFVAPAAGRRRSTPRQY